MKATSMYDVQSRVEGVVYTVRPRKRKLVYFSSPRHIFSLLTKFSGLPPSGTHCK